MANQDSRNDKKRARDELNDSDFDSSVSKITRVDSLESDWEQVDSDDSGSGSDELARVEPDPDDFDIRSTEARRIQYDLLNALDGADEGADGAPTIQDLDSVIRSFEVEMLVPAPVSEYEISSGSGGDQLDLGYLLEASDDELGLPPKFSSGDEQNPEVIGLDADGPAVDGFAQFASFEDQMPCYDSFELGIGFDSGSHQANDGYNFNGTDFLPLGCLFEHTDAGFEPYDVSEISWRPESLSAI